MPYDPMLVKPMREELTRLGVQELLYRRRRRPRHGREVRHRDDRRQLRLRLRRRRRAARHRARAQARGQARHHRHGLRRPGHRGHRTRPFVLRGQPAELARHRAVQGRQARPADPALGDRGPRCPQPDREGADGHLRPALRQAAERSEVAPTRERCRPSKARSLVSRERGCRAERAEFARLPQVRRQRIDPPSHQRSRSGLFSSSSRNSPTFTGAAFCAA